MKKPLFGKKKLFQKNQPMNQTRKPLKSGNPGVKLTLFLICALAYMGCKKDDVRMNRNNTAIEAQTKTGAIQQPSVGGKCNLNPPLAPKVGAGTSLKKSWYRIAKNQSQLISAINYVNSNGGTIYIDATFNITKSLPAITRNNVTILSKKAHKIYDKVAGGSISELFRVEGSNFTMKNVTILGVGHTKPNNPSAWAGKRSAITINDNNSRFERVHIRYYTHAAIRLESGSGHKILTCTLTNQNRSDLGYGVLLRNNANGVLVKRTRFDKNSHSVATTGGKNQSYRAEGNWSTNSTKWHFDVHMGADGWGGKKVEIINNVTKGTNSLLVVRGPFTNGVFVIKNLHNLSAGKLVELNPDATFTQNGTTFNAGQFYSPFGLDKFIARKFFMKGFIKNNCVKQSYNAQLASAGN